MSAISMARRYTAAMRPRQSSLPLIWLLTDARNDHALSDLVHRLPPRSGIVFRHYHLPMEARQAQFRDLAATAKSTGNHVVVLAGMLTEAQAWGADGFYGPANAAAEVGGLLHLATAHDGDELAAANAAGADGTFLSPVFPTRSHPDRGTLGPHGFHVLAQQASMPVIALGGMNAARAHELNWPRWGAIDGLGSAQFA